MNLNEIYKNITYEIAVVGYKNKNEVSIFNSLFTDSSSDFVMIPPEIQMKLIKYCIANHSSPVIIHNHKDNCNFSEPDLYFLQRFKTFIINVVRNVIFILF